MRVSLIGLTTDSMKFASILHLTQTMRARASFTLVMLAPPSNQNIGISKRRWLSELDCDRYSTSIASMKKRKVPRHFAAASYSFLFGIVDDTGLHATVHVTLGIFASITQRWRYPMLDVPPCSTYCRSQCRRHDWIFGFSIRLEGKH